jgi:uncharacterized protein
VKIAIQDIKEVPQTATFARDVEELNALLRHGTADFVATAPIGVSVSYYRAGMDVFLDGNVHANLSGHCGRCLSDYPFDLTRDFTVVLAPESELGPQGDTGKLGSDDLALSYYAGEEIDLSPLVDEQLILALPTRPLCTTSCRGLCPQCGTSLNTRSCGCTIVREDPRLAVLRTLKVGDLKRR